MIDPRLYLTNPFDVSNEAEMLAAWERKGAFRLTVSSSVMEPLNPEGGDGGHIVPAKLPILSM